MYAYKKKTISRCHVGWQDKEINSSVVQFVIIIKNARLQKKDFL